MSFVRCKGGKKERIIPMGHQAKDALENYINNVRKYMVKDENETALFVNCSGARLSRQGFWKLIKYYMEYMGIVEITGSPRETIQNGFNQQIIEDGEEWIEMMVSRNSLAHTYDEKASREIYDKIKNQSDVISRVFLRLEG